MATKIITERRKFAKLTNDEISEENGFYPGQSLGILKKLNQDNQVISFR